MTTTNKLTKIIIIIAGKTLTVGVSTELMPFSAEHLH